MASTIEPPQTRREAENKRKEKKETSAICIPEPRKHQTRPWKAQHRIKTILNWIPFIWNSLQVRRRCLQIRETIIHPNTTSYGARTQGFLHENDERERKRERERVERERVAFVGSFLLGWAWVQIWKWRPLEANGPLLLLGLISWRPIFQASCVDSF